MSEMKTSASSSRLLWQSSVWEQRWALVPLRWHGVAGEPGQQEKAHKAINTDIYGKLLHGTISQDIYGKFSQGGIWLVNPVSAGLLGMLVQLPIL